MTLLTLLLVLLALGAAAWVVLRSTFITGEFKELIQFVLIVIGVVVVLQFFGVWAAFRDFKFGR